VGSAQPELHVGAPYCWNTFTDAAGWPVAGMFVLGDDGRLVGLTEKTYDSEDLLQSLLASYPDLLAGEQIAPEAPRRWLLVSRETGVPDAPDATGRWSVDHLFLDQDGVPTLIEVKRSLPSRPRGRAVPSAWRSPLTSRAPTSGRSSGGG
jgi:hypothetical protein